MKQIQNSFQFILTIALMAFLAGCASTAVNKENTLVSAGFKVITPKNATQEAKLQTLAPGRLNTVIKNGKTYYVYPDAPHNRAYVGGVQEYNYYKVLRTKQKVATSNLMEDQEDRPIAADLNWSSDSSWGGNGW